MDYGLSEKDCMAFIAKAMEVPWDDESAGSRDNPVYRSAQGAIAFLQTNPMLNETLEMIDADERYRLTGGLMSFLDHHANQAVTAYGKESATEVVRQFESAIRQHIQDLQTEGSDHPWLKEITAKMTAECDAELAALRAKVLACG